jgi:signal peptidase I
MNKTLENIKKEWNWIWNSDSLLSWVVALVLIFVFVKLIFFPGLSFILGTSLPLAGVESSSMDHQIVGDEFGRYLLCGEIYDKKDKKYVDFNEYWEICGEWYVENGITKKQFKGFTLKNGFAKGDIIVVWGRFVPKVGDIIIFQANSESSAPRPIIHRIVSIDDGVIATKGDHNAEQLKKGNNAFNTDETTITEDRIIGKAVLKIPYLGWPKIWLVEGLKLIFG